MRSRPAIGHFAVRGWPAGLFVVRRYILEQDLLQGALVTIEDSHIRLRRLPLIFNLHYL